MESLNNPSKTSLHSDDETPVTFEDVHSEELHVNDDEAGKSFFFEYILIIDQFVKSWNNLGNVFDETFIKVKA